MVSSESAGEAANHSPTCAEVLLPNRKKKKKITWGRPELSTVGKSKGSARLGCGLKWRVVLQQFHQENPEAENDGSMCEHTLIRHLHL